VLSTSSRPATTAPSRGRHTGARCTSPAPAPWHSPARRAQLLGAASSSWATQPSASQARSFGCETIDLEAPGRPDGSSWESSWTPPWTASVSNRHATATPRPPPPSSTRGRRAGRGGIGIPGLYVTGDPGATDEAAKIGSLTIRIGLGWAKSHHFHTVQCPVMKYHRQLMMAILHDKIAIAKAVNATVITLNDAPKGYADFDKGAARKFIIDPHGMVA
jgi:glutathione-independent formaldehyde dehydrogenase